MKYISLFAGIGGFDLALNRLGHECVYVNEWDKYAVQTYEKNFRTNICRCDRDTTKRNGESSSSQQSIQPAKACIQCGQNISNTFSSGGTGKIQHPPVDTTSIADVSASFIPQHDLLVGGFPCQAFSVAGLRRGFDEVRGTLFFDIARILKHHQTKYFILENVKGLTNHDGGRTFRVILKTLTELGYDLQWQVLNSKNFGVPQNRERVFIVGHLRGERRPQVFPIRESESISPEGERETGKTVANTLRAKQGGPDIDQTYVSRYPLKFAQRNQRSIQGDYAYTVDSANTGGVIVDWKIRRLTPIECERLQGFPDNWTQGVSDTQRYKQLGNAVTVNVVYEVAKHL